MRTRIRLSRFGTNKKAAYRIVVAGVKSARNGQFLDVVGHYDPFAGVEKAKLEKEKVALWIKKGAQPTDIVRQIIRRAGT